MNFKELFEKKVRLTKEQTRELERIQQEAYFEKAKVLAKNKAERQAKTKYDENNEM